MIEPQLLELPLAEPQNQGTSAANAVPIRLLDTQARGHIGRRVLHQQPDGELTEDPMWRWSSAPDRYLDTALRLELSRAPHCASSMSPARRRWPQRFSPGNSSLQTGHDSSGLSSSRSRGGPRGPDTSGAEASPCPMCCRAIWLPPPAAFCDASRPKGWRASHAHDEEIVGLDQHIKNGARTGAVSTGTGPRNGRRFPIRSGSAVERHH